MINQFVCFFINLEKCTERNKHCTSILQQLNFDEINHIIPTDKFSKEILHSEQTCNGKCMKKGHPASFKSLSFTSKKILEKILTLPDNYYFIFEDDIHLNDNIEPSNFKNLINQFICEYPNEPIYYLGVILDKQSTNAYNNNTFKTKMGWGTHAYMLNHEGANFLLQNINCWHKPLDGLYKSILNGFGSGNISYTAIKKNNSYCLDNKKLSKNIKFSISKKYILNYCKNLGKKLNA